eukprot:3862256-Alexandrium_andersonii.AAC.1
MSEVEARRLGATDIRTIAPVKIGAANGSVVCTRQAHAWLSQLKVSAPVRLLPGAPKLPSLGLLCKSTGFRFLWPADANRPEVVFPSRHQLRGAGVRLEVGLNAPVVQTDWGASAFVDAHTLGTAVDEGTV